ncbi:hypothetical protein [Lachnobacterium bovis]|uniref:hypothetical protein n=1 Tax=Lachnobacterium bovis TaxID=140626 RepID=UPI0003B66C44|nr:hypothetical protein [Lachnobacterium bovis]
MDAGKYYGEANGFCLMHNSLKQQCSEAIQKCQLLTYRYAKPNQVLKEIVDTTAIKAKGFDGIRQSSSDYMIYINMVSASIASFENDYARLYQNAGDEDLIGSQLLADRARLSDLLNDATKTQHDLKVRKANIENVAAVAGQNLAQIVGEQIKISNRIIDGYTLAIKQINEKIEKYYQIENNTRNYFKQGEEYSTKAQNILDGISKSFKGAEYHYDENAAWRVDYLKSMDDMNVIYKDRAINYLKYRGVTEDEFKQLAKYNFASTEVYNYITLTNSKENEKFIMNIIHKKYDDSFKKDPSTLDSYAKTFMGKYALGVWGVMYEKGDKASKEDYEKLINAVLSDNKESVVYYKYGVKKVKEVYKKDNCEGVPFDELMAAPKIKEYLDILSNTTLVIMKTNENVATSIYFNEKDSDSFKHFQREWNKDMSCYMCYKVLADKVYKYSFECNINGKNKGISKITNIELSGTKGRAVPNIDFDFEDKEGAKKSQHIKYARDKQAKRQVTGIWQIEKECKEGPHEVEDKLNDIAKTMIVAGATEINPFLGLAVEVGCTYFSEEGITNSYLEDKGKDAVKWVNEKTNATEKAKERASDIYQNHISPHMTNIAITNSPYGSVIFRGTKAGITSVVNVDNIIGLSKAIYNDAHFNEKMSKKKKKYLEDVDTSYICCKGDEMSSMSMQSLDLTTQIYKEQLKNKQKYVYSKDDNDANEIKIKLKRKKDKASELALKLLKGECAFSDDNLSDKDADLYFQAVSLLQEEGPGGYNQKFSTGVSHLEDEIVNCQNE